MCLPAYSRPLPTGNKVTHLMGNVRDMHIRLGAMDPFQAHHGERLHDTSFILWAAEGQSIRNLVLKCA